MLGSYFELNCEHNLLSTLQLTVAMIIFSEFSYAAANFLICTSYWSPPTPYDVKIKPIYLSFMLKNSL